MEIKEPIKKQKKEIPVLFKGFRIETMKEEDFPAYQEYRDKIAKETESYIVPTDQHTYSEVLKIYSMSSKRAFLVWKNGKVYGELFVSVLVKGECCFVNLIAVEESVRCQGLGKALIDVAIALGKRFGCVGIDLGVERGNEKVIAFYKRLGFKEIRLFNETTSMSKRFF